MYFFIHSPHLGPTSHTHPILILQHNNHPINHLLPSLLPLHRRNLLLDIVPFLQQPRHNLGLLLALLQMPVVLVWLVVLFAFGAEEGGGDGFGLAAAVQAGVEHHD